MRAKVLNEFAGARKYALTLDGDDEIIACLTAFARDHGVQDAFFSGLGTLRHATLGWFNSAIKKYAPTPIEGQAELLMLSGRITELNGLPDISAHVVLGKSDGTADGGHLLQATVQSNAHVFVEETPNRARRPAFSTPAFGIATELCGVQLA